MKRAGIYCLGLYRTGIEIFFGSGNKRFHPGRAPWSSGNRSGLRSERSKVQTSAGAEFFRQKIQLSCPQENSVCRMIHMKQDDAGS